MQTINLTSNKSAVTATISSPIPTPTQQSVTPVPAAPPPPGIDAEFLQAIDEFAMQLRQYAANSLGWRIMVGLRLHEFRDGLGIDDWNLLLHSGRLPFSSRKAQTLARIGGHSILVDMRNTNMLPHSSTVLNEIAALPPSVVELALRNGAIHADTTLEEAKGLVAEHRAAKAASLVHASGPRLL